MRIQPREELLTLWRSVVNASLDENGDWKWGGRNGRNSISDAEQLLTIMYPALEIPLLGLDQPDKTAQDILGALRGLGDELDLPLRLVSALTAHILAYRDTDLNPVFPGGQYLKASDEKRELSQEQLGLDMVDSFSMSVTLMLSTLSFVKGFRNATSGTASVDLEELRALEELASERLTAAMVGLLRSFVINVFTQDDDQGQNLLQMVGGGAIPTSRQMADELRSSLQNIRAVLLEDVTIGLREIPKDLNNRNRLFEIGWTWGVALKAPEIENLREVKVQRDGFAEAAPFLYFTVNALDGIADLFSARTTTLALLNDEQQRLAQSLRLRWELTQQYWSAIATFNPTGRWALQDVPWRTTDGRESEHFSLLVASVVIQDAEIRERSGLDHRRLARILDELGQRGRVTRRATVNDEALRLHVPGTEVQLGGSEGIGGGPELKWRLNDYTPLLLKNTVRLAILSEDPDDRTDLVRNADRLWEHLLRRRLRSSRTSLWDDASRVFAIGDGQEHPDQISWYYTERVVECLVMTMKLMYTRSARNQPLEDYARGILAETDSLLDFEMLTNLVSDNDFLRDELLDGRRRLNHAQQIVSVRPATAVGLAMDILRTLESYKIARQNAVEEVS